MVKMRLFRMGDKKNPIYRVVVADSRKAMHGEYIDCIGHYNPSIIDSKRKRRIAAGSGTSVQEINQLLKQFEQTKMVMKQLKGGK